MSAVIAAMAVLAGLALLLGGTIVLFAHRLRGSDDTAVEQLNALLPQTQCAQCGYPGCRPYAQAMLAGRAQINQCPPGGEATVRALARLLGREVLPVGAEYGRAPPPQVAVIDETRCIGCTLCIRACPVDAIVGAQQFMHTVIERECTGCELCLPACPVDCIELLPIRPRQLAGSARLSPAGPLASARAKRSGASA